jgi:hypothetical protein
LSVTEAGDTVSSAATLAIKATASITEANDTLSATGKPPSQAWNPDTSNNVDSFSTYQGVESARAVSGEKGGTGSGVNTRDDLISSTGKTYFEIDIANIDTAGGWGDISYFVLQTIEGYGYIYLAYDNGPATSYIQDQVNSASRNLSAALKDGDNVGFAIDNANQKAWFRINGGAWQDATDATGNDPASGTGGISYAGLGKLVNLSFQTSRGNFDLGLRTGSSVYSVPVGFTYIDGTSGPVGSLVKIWNGSAWVSKSVKVWNGSAWVNKTLKVRIDASTWY